MDVTLIFDLLIAILLVATICYAVILNRKLGAFRDAKSEMEALIGQFSESTDRASDGVQSLKEEARSSGKILQEKIEAARGLVDDLGFLIERGGGLAQRLDGGVGVARAQAGAAAGRVQAPANRTLRVPAAIKTETKPARGDTASREAQGSAPGSAPGDSPGDATGDPQGETGVEIAGEAGDAEAGAPESAAVDLSAAESELLKALQGMR